MKNSDFIKGINIIAKYIPEGDNDKYHTSFGYAQMCFGNKEWITDEMVIVELKQLGWFISLGK